MRKSKLIFVILSIVFVIVLIIVAMDISSRTTFPGNKKYKTDQNDVDSTSVERDSIN